MNWRAWLKLERLIPSATILFAFAAQILELLEIIQLSVGEKIVLALIGLLAVDALTERLTVLEKIRTEIKEAIKHRARSSDFLQTRIELPPMDKRLARAQSLEIAGMSLLGMSTQHHELLLKKVKDGCRIRLLLLNHKNESLVQATAVFVGSLAPEAHAQEIITSLNTLTSDSAFLDSGLVQIRTYDYPLAHGLFIINGETPEGEMRVEMYMHRRRPTGTPGFFIRKAEDPGWFDVFWKEFNYMWENARPYQAGAAQLVAGGDSAYRR